MSHYRNIEMPTGPGTTTTFRYVVGRWQTKIVGIGVFHNHVIGNAVGNPEDEKVSVTPADIARVIRLSANAPAAVRDPYPWDKPPVEPDKPKKVDAGPKSRGFAKLCGHEVETVTVSLNQVVLHCTSGARFTINTDESSPLGIPKLVCVQECLPDPSFD